MVKPVRIYRHDEPVGAGYFLDFLESQKYEYELIAIDQGDAVTFDFDKASGLVFLGSDFGVNDSHVWIEDELRLIQQAAEKNFPIFGHCFGAQLISKALGEKVSPMPSKEIGWFKVDWVQNKIAKEWFRKLSDDTCAIHWHGYALTVPMGATPLFGTNFCPNQAFVVDNIVATTAHVEATATLVKQWVVDYGDNLIPATQTVQSEAEIVKDLASRVANMQRLADVLYERWLKMVKHYHSA